MGKVMKQIIGAIRQISYVTKIITVGQSRGLERYILLPRIQLRRLIHSATNCSIILIIFIYVLQIGSVLKEKIALYIFITYFDLYLHYNTLIYLFFDI